MASLGFQEIPESAVHLLVSSKQQGFVVICEPQSGCSWLRLLGDYETLHEQALSQEFAEQHLEGAALDLVRGISAIRAHYEVKVYNGPGSLWMTWGLYRKEG